MVWVEVLGLMVLLVGGAIAIGSKRWQSNTAAIRSSLEAARRPITPQVYDPAEIEALPVPVQQYFRAVLKPGQPMVAAVEVTHVGTFNLSQTAEQWKPFTSTQRVITQRPGFDWNADIVVAPGLTVRVHDAYLAGEGKLQAALLGLITVADRQGTPDLAQGELMRFLAEAAWYPTALLPSQGVRWTGIDDHSAQATLEDGDTTLTLLFRFDKNSLIESVRAEARGRTVGNAVVSTPWEGYWSQYEWRGEMRIPLAGEVVWMLPEGPQPYWRGYITDVAYEWAT